MSTYRALILKGKGGLDQLEVVERPLPEPKAGELRVRVRATGAGSTDISMRTGNYPYAPPFPFSPGYEVVGEVDALGEGVTGFSQGQRVAGLVVHGGQAEFMVREAEHFVPVPDALDDPEVVALILNYMTAYQMIYRTAAMREGQNALVTGANGGVGSAALDLLRNIKVRAIGSAAKAHFDLVRELGAEPIESRGRALDEQVRELVPNGVDESFDGLGGAGTRACIRSTRKGGQVIGYGFMAAQKNGRSSIPAVLRGFAALYLGAPLAGRRSTFYGITRLYRKNPQPFREDLPKLFDLLKERKIRPRIAARLPLLAGVEAQRMLLKGGVVGKIVLLRDVAE
jgi:NADPH:quinone reductase-like Zn-dependent oxidoreductase